MLLTPTDATSDVVALIALRQVIIPNTQLALSSVSGTGIEQVYINDIYAMSLGSFPAVHLSSSDQAYGSISRSTYQGQTELTITYYDRWDRQAATIDMVFAALSLDLERMRANLESNDHLVVSGQAYLKQLISLTMSPYKSELDETTVPDIPLVSRSLVLRCILPEYDS